MSSPQQHTIDFVSDVACPWCAVGLHALERALARLGAAPGEWTLRFHPFELNPQMGAEGEDAAEHLARKYGLTPQQLEANRENLRRKGAEVGFEFGARTRVWNTFDAHRLLHWAGLQGAAQQRALKQALLTAYHGRDENPGALEVLLRAAAGAGLNEAEAREVLQSNRYADEVRAAERQWQGMGIHSVPSIILDEKYLIQGAQPVEVFERVLRQVQQGQAA
jgi:predicted DsbA family dithiol-disulfide isomerase